MFSIGIESHFPLISLIRYFLQIFISSFAEMLLPFTTENNDVFSAKSLTVHSKLSDMSSDKGKNGPRMESCSAPALAGNHSDD